MPKYLIPFVSNKNWKSNPNCHICSNIDELYDKASKESNLSKVQDILNKLDDVYVVNGRGLLDVYESKGDSIYKKSNIKRINRYRTVTTAFLNKAKHIMNPDKYPPLYDYTSDRPVLNHSRWCKNCGSRKPDIYDPSCDDNYDYLTINNFFTNLNLDEKSCLITWEDCNIFNYYKTKLIRGDFLSENDIVLEEYTDRNKYANTPFVDSNLKKGNVYYYQVFCYDNLDNVIQKSEIKKVYLECDDIVLCREVENLELFQNKELNQETNEVENYIYVNYTNPNDENWDETKIIYRENFVPDNEYDGREVIDNKVLISDSDNLNTTYYFKPFVFNKPIALPYDNNNEYYLYRHKNSNSPMNFIEVFDYKENVSNISYDNSKLDGEIKVMWDDPIHENWIETRVVYKKDSCIKKYDDGILYDVIKERNKYSNSPLTISNLDNGQVYYIGIIPIYENGIVNIDLKNQIKITTGYYVKDVSIDFNDHDYLDHFKYLGKWEIIEDENGKLNLGIKNILYQEESLCYIEKYNFKYGGFVSFDYQINCKDSLDVFINNKEVVSLNSAKVFDYYKWKNHIIKFDSLEYLNFGLRFIKNNKCKDDYILINNIRIHWNSH